MRNVAFVSKLSVSDNTISSTGGNGVAVVSVSQACDCVNPEAVVISDNSVMECKANGIYLSDTYCCVLNCECTQNGHKGIVLTRLRPEYVASTKTTGYKAKVTGCVAQRNVTGGMAIVDTADTRILVEGCRLNKNGEYGMMASNGEASPSVDSQDDENAAATMKGGEVCENARGGLMVSGHSLLVDGTCIKYNGMGVAVYMENCRSRVLYSDATLKRKSVQGTVKNRVKEFNIYAGYKSTTPCCACTIV